MAFPILELDADQQKRLDAIRGRAKHGQPSIRTAPPPRRDLLTDRQIEIVLLMSHGFSNDEIARELFLSANTVKSHTKKIMALLEARSRTHGVAIALREGLIA